MHRVIDVLKAEVDRRNLAVPASEEVFDLLLGEACSECCSDHSGGNGTCPPPPKKETELAG